MTPIEQENLRAQIADWRSSLKPQELSISRKRPGRRDVMTIAAGFQCTDGIVLCADSEMTVGNTLKLDRGNISHFSDKGCAILFSPAGHADFVKMTIQRAVDVLPVRKQRTFHSIQKAIEKATLEIHKNQIRYYPAKSDEKPFVSFLAAVWLEGHGFRLFKISGTSITPAHFYECLGSGAEIGEYVAARLYTWTMDTKEATALAIYVLRETKAFSAYCGKRSHIWVLDADGNFDLFESTKVVQEEEYFDHFDSLYQTLAFSGYGKNLTDDEFQARLDEFNEGLKGVRKARIDESEETMYGLSRIILG